MRRSYLIVCCVMCATSMASTVAVGQDHASDDTTRVVRIVTAESTLDSLRAEMRTLDRQIQLLKQNFADGSDLEQLLEALGETGTDAEQVPEDTRSRRQRVDALLKAITQRPGQLRFNGGSTAVVQGIIAGEPEGTAGAGSIDLYAHTSFGPGTLLFFAFEAGSGAGIDGALPFFLPVNGDAAPTRNADGYDLLVLQEGWAEWTAFDEVIQLTAGKIDLTNYFDINNVANDETAQFLSSAFVNSAALEAPGPGPGVRARTVILNRFSFQVGASSADSTGGTRFEDPFLIGETGLLLFTREDHRGNLRVYAFSPTERSGSFGWGTSYDQRLAASWTVFGRYGNNNDILVDAGAVESAWSAGLQYSPRGHKRYSAVGAAFGVVESEPDVEEKTFEAYASWQLNTWTFVSPHFQIVHSEKPTDGTVGILGMRVQFNF